MSTETSKGMNIGVWVVSALLAALFLFSAVGKLSGQAQAVQGFRSYGFSDSFRVFIGVCEGLGAIALLIPPVATLSACGLSIVMVGALFTHLTHNEVSHAIPVMVFLGLLLFVAYARRDAIGKVFNRGVAPAAH